MSKSCLAAAISAWTSRNADFAAATCSATLISCLCTMAANLTASTEVAKNRQVDGQRAKVIKSKPSTCSTLVNTAQHSRLSLLQGRMATACVGTHGMTTSQTATHLLCLHLPTRTSCILKADHSRAVPLCEFPTLPGLLGQSILQAGQARVMEVQVPLSQHDCAVAPKVACMHKVHCRAVLQAGRSK